MRLIFLNSMGSQLFNALSMIKIGQKLASVRYFELCTRTRKMTPPYENSQWRGQKKTSPNFKISYRSEFLSNLNNRKCVGKLRSRRIQTNMSFFSCVHFARRMAKTRGLTILKLFCAWWVYIKRDLFFFEFYGILAFQRTLDDQNRTKTRFCVFI